MILDIQENKLILVGDLKRRFENHWDLIEDQMWEDDEYIESFGDIPDPEDVSTWKTPEVENYFYENYLFPMNHFKDSIICE